MSHFIPFRLTDVEPMATMSIKQMKLQAFKIWQAKSALGDLTRCCNMPQPSVEYDVARNVYIVGCLRCRKPLLTLTPSAIMSASPDSARTQAEKRKSYVPPASARTEQLAETMRERKTPRSPTRQQEKPGKAKPKPDKVRNAVDVSRFANLEVDDDE